MKSNKNDNQAFKDLADELKLLICFDLQMETKRTTQAHLRILEHWLQKNDKLIPQICMSLPSSAWTELDLPVAIKMAELKLKHPTAPIPLKIILSHTYIDEEAPEEGIKLIRHCVPNLGPPDLDAFSSVLKDFLGNIKGTSNGDFLKKEISDILEGFRIKCSEFNKEKIFSSFISGLDFSSLSFVKPLLSKKATTQSLKGLETGVVSLIKELKKKNVSEKNLKTLLGEISEDKMAKNPPIALLDGLTSLLVDEKSDTVMTCFLKACSSASETKLKYLLPDEKSMAWFLIQVNAQKQKDVVPLLASLKVHKDYINNLLSQIIQNTISIDRGEDVGYVKKGIRVIELFAKNQAEFTKFNSVIGYDDIYGWIDDSNKFPKTKKVQEVFTALASVSPNEVSALLSCVFTINDVQWQPPKETSSFKIDNKDFKATLKSYKDDLDNGEDYYLKMYQKTEHFVNLHQRSLLLSKVKSPVKPLAGKTFKQEPVKKARKM